MVRSVTIFDEDFTEDDMHGALEWQSEDALKCSGCGGPTDETMAPGRDDDYDAELKVCHRCAAGERTKRSHLQQPNPETAGLKVLTFEAD